MFSFARTVVFAGMMAGIAVPAWAADLYQPPVEEAPAEPVYQPVEPVDVGGWYIRGDLDYHWMKMGGAPRYITTPGGYNEFSTYALRGAPSLGLGVGYQVNDHFRVDVTGDYWFKSSFHGSTTGICPGGGACQSTEVSKVSTYLLLANAYADLGTWNGITPYIGAGIGGAHIKWDTVYDPTPPEHNPGSKNWRFAYALMAGASYCLTDHWKLDAGYRFTHIQGGRMFDWDATSSGPGFDKGYNVHEVRGGLRYQFGGGSSCSPPPPAYEPAPEPIYTK